jgi:ribulose-phosphate 3-epimerase
MTINPYVVSLLKIAPSILSADFGQLSSEVRKVEEAGADILHIDVMDGHFVPNLSIGPMIVKSIRAGSHLFFDVHLMVDEPEKFINSYVDAGADMITIHGDKSHRLYETISVVKSLKRKVGVALCPMTPLNQLDYVLSDVDLILIMSVEPGFGGQSFIPSILAKIREARKIINSKGLKIDLAVDGGLNEQTVRKVVEAGANVLIMGSAVFGKNSQSEIKELFRSIRDLQSE